jgi:hypothetical protein
MGYLSEKSWGNRRYKRAVGFSGWFEWPEGMNDVSLSGVSCACASNGHPRESWLASHELCCVFLGGRGGIDDHCHGEIIISGGHQYGQQLVSYIHTCLRPYMCIEQYVLYCTLGHSPVHVLHLSAAGNHRRVLSPTSSVPFSHSASQTVLPVPPQLTRLPKYLTSSLTVPTELLSAYFPPTFHY